MPHRFNPEMMHILESPERYETMRPDQLVERLGAAAGQTVVDIGCGTGFFTIPFARAVAPGGTVFAVDVEQKMLDYLESRLAEEGVKNVTTVLSRQDSTTLEPGLADLVFSSSLLHEIDPDTPLFADMCGLLKPGAKLVIVDWKKEPTPGGPPAGIRLSEAQAVGLLGEKGFRHIDSCRAGPTHYCLVFETAGRC